MTAFSELAARRSSVRGYRPDPVDTRLLDEVLEAGRLAPSAANRQPWRIVVVRDQAVRLALHRAYPRDWFLQAPIVLVVCIEPAAAWQRSDGKNYADVDGAILMDHLTLCAADLGLGTCWIGAFDPAGVRAALSLPAGIEPLAMTPLGWPDDGVREKKRKAREEIVRLERW
jgi:nitroreductase